MSMREVLRRASGVSGKKVNHRLRDVALHLIKLGGCVVPPKDLQASMEVLRNFVSEHLLRMVRTRSNGNKDSYSFAGSVVQRIGNICSADVHNYSKSVTGRATKS